MSLEESIYRIDRKGEAKRTVKQKTVCPGCKGEGVIEFTEFYGNTAGKVVKYETCAVCDGKRVVNRVTVEWYEKI